MFLTKIASAMKKPRLSGLVSLLALTGLAAYWGMPQTASHAASSPTAKTKGFVVTYFWYANYEGDDDCPTGPAPGMRRLATPLLAKVPQAERERLLSPGNEQQLAAVLSAFALGGKAYGGATDRTEDIVGPPLSEAGKKAPKSAMRDFSAPVNDQCLFPASFEDPVQKTAQGKIAYGMNLDGSDGKQAAPNTCAHEKFTGASGEAGIDNQMYRVIGCVDGYRRKAAQSSPTSVSAGTVEDWYHGTRKDGGTTMLIEVTGITDDHNSPDVRVAIYPSAQATPYDGQGKNGIPNYSLTAGPPDVSPGFSNVAHGRIVDGVLTTDPVDLQIPLIAPYNKSTPYYARAARLRLELQPDGSAKGLLAGYLDVEKAYYTEVAGHGVGTSISEAVFDGDCPAFYAALHRMADGFPDPKTGRCTAISSAFKVEAVPAFVIHPKDEKTKTADAATPQPAILASNMTVGSFLKKLGW